MSLCNGGKRGAGERQERPVCLLLATGASQGRTRSCLAWPRGPVRWFQTAQGGPGSWMGRKSRTRRGERSDTLAALPSALQPAVGQCSGAAAGQAGRQNVLLALLLARAERGLEVVVLLCVAFVGHHFREKAVLLSRGRAVAHLDHVRSQPGALAAREEGVDATLGRCGRGTGRLLCEETRRKVGPGGGEA